MLRLIRNTFLAVTLLTALGFGAAHRAEARGHGHFSVSIGVPFGYYGGGYYGGGIGYGGYYRGPGFGAYYGSAWPGYYPYYPPYAFPRPVTYPRPEYRAPYYGPIVSLALFPAYVGDALSYEDRNLYLTAYRRALAAPVGEPIDWNSSKAAGAVTTTRDGWAGQRYCREFRQEITIDGRAQEATGTACQQPGGDWQLVQNQ